MDRLTKRFGSVTAVENLTMLVDAGEVFGFLGPNGAGKSTTIRMLLGQIRPTSGTATIFGNSVEDVLRAHRCLAYVPADVALWPRLTGIEILELLAAIGPNVDFPIEMNWWSGSILIFTSRPARTPPAIGRRWR